jgi:Mg2+ and Co2+ transporter CorA
VSTFSMNVPIPMDKHRFAFLVIICLATISAAGVMLWWRRANSFFYRRNGKR